MKPLFRQLSEQITVSYRGAGAFGNILLFGFVAFASFVHAEPSQTLNNLNAGNNQVIVLYGTSLTEKGAWPGLLEEWLKSLSTPGNATVLNKGISGSTTQSHGIKNIQRDIVGEKADTVIIEFGMNDCIKRLADLSANPPREKDSPISVPLETFRANLKQIVGEIREALPQAELYLMTMNGAFDSKQTPNSGRFRAALPEYYQAVRDVAVKENIKLIDTNIRWKEIEAGNPAHLKTLIPDGVHPSAAGCREVTFPVVKSAILGETPTNH